MADEKRPSDYMLEVRNESSIIAFMQAKTGGMRLEEAILAHMRTKMADHIVRSRVERTETANVVRHRLSVYVLDGDELYSLIRREAERLTYCPFDLDLGK